MLSAQELTLLEHNKRQLALEMEVDVNSMINTIKNVAIAYKVQDSVHYSFKSIFGTQTTNIDFSCEVITNALGDFEAFSVLAQSLLSVDIYLNMRYEEPKYPFSNHYRITSGPTADNKFMVDVVVNLYKKKEEKKHKKNEEEKK